MIIVTLKYLNYRKFGLLNSINSYLMKVLNALCFLFIPLLISCSKKDNGEIQPTKGTITESVYASGVVKSENQYTVYSTVNGVLQKVNVTAGQTIVQGQSLFQIESDKAALNTENARLAYQLSNENNHYIQDKISEMETKVQAAKDKLALDQSVYNRNKNIKQYNVISEVEYERVELAYKNSKSNYEAALKQLSQLKAQLQNEQSRSNINLKINEKAQNDFNVKSAASEGRNINYHTNSIGRYWKKEFVFARIGC